MANLCTSRLNLVALLVCVFTLISCGSARAAELIMFEEQGCPWCERWRREVGVGYPSTAEGKRAPLRRIDITQSRASGVQLASPVVVSPTFVLADNGREIGRIIGYPGADFFWGLLAELLVKLDRASMGHDTEAEPSTSSIYVAKLSPIASKLHR
jgi:hypothetical protein